MAAFLSAAKNRKSTVLSQVYNRPLKPIPPRYSNGKRVRKSRKRGVEGLCYVYVAEYPAADAVKIGRSTDPRERAKQLSTEIGSPIFLRWYGQTDVAGAQSLERAFHKAHKRDKAVHIVGEWYSRSAETAVAEVMRLAEGLGLSLSTTGTQETLSGTDAWIAERNREGFTLKSWDLILQN